ncbi:hypothetical protein [Allosphingosinicella indica]|uniref:DUF4410 domain-containing protein n=1 Tax=Allosphingosinicella indica TaxID=941907 RepID=A0A1X7FZE9_9SPHN|nr:hypothetical protein [Allosphingosinicella indica]SMF61485.1 hypothetical protein SAMN06295910_0475 [Allosphingosinicella indica]
MRLSILATLFLLTACAGTTDEVLPVARDIRGVSYVQSASITVTDMARPSVARLDAIASGKATGPASSNFRALLHDMILREVGQERGRPIALTVEIDDLKVTNFGGALLGSSDRMAGTVFLYDPATGASLGQLYIDVTSRSPGLLGAALRGSGVREQMVSRFVRRLSDALSPGNPRSPGQAPARRE